LRRPCWGVEGERGGRLGWVGLGSVGMGWVRLGWVGFGWDGLAMVSLLLVERVEGMVVDVNLTGADPCGVPGG